MKNYTEKERIRHLKNWKNGEMSKAEYAKSAGIIPTTFYSWAKGIKEKGNSFVEVRQENTIEENQEIVIEKGDMKIRFPLSAEIETLKVVLTAIGSIQ